eukprot:gnl/TRDRNA2_/TRDRNA2_172933_c0_seq4.p1 gnl/TRDRNA2_/TRDRNA2_172933_c0~~gnl/TRDRNA2_/TRDRNA2_172933_c0_seq4.p1  ORF type:complete len:432 (+),score=62.37 gnl/TRDRNA2_/TRDRNA2_172933_c0_seq4:61-1356(+)
MNRMSSVSSSSSASSFASSSAASLQRGIYRCLVPAEWERWSMHSYLQACACTFAAAVVALCLCLLAKDEVFWLSVFAVQVTGISVAGLGLHAPEEYPGSGRSAICTLFRRSVLPGGMALLGAGSVVSLVHRFVNIRDGILPSSKNVAIHEYLCLPASQVCSVAAVMVIAFIVFRQVVVLNAFAAVKMIRRWRVRVLWRPRSVLVPDLEAAAPGECSVCLEELSEDNGDGVLRLMCGHTFHMQCCMCWLASHDSCPVCRCQVCDLSRCEHLRREKGKEEKSIIDMPDLEANVDEVEAVKRDADETGAQQKPTPPEGSPVLSEASTATPSGCTASVTASPAWLPLPISRDISFTDAEQGAGRADGCHLRATAEPDSPRPVCLSDLDSCIPTGSASDSFGHIMSWANENGDGDSQADLDGSNDEELLGHSRTQI